LIQVIQGQSKDVKVDAHVLDVTAASPLLGEDQQLISDGIK
jgi:hypothetical protein